MTDLVGTPTELVDEHGELAWKARATAWGALLEGRSSAGVYCPLAFPGQYRDLETALHYNYQRHYDPEIETRSGFRRLVRTPRAMPPDGGPTKSRRGRGPIRTPGPQVPPGFPFRGMTHRSAVPVSRAAATTICIRTCGLPTTGFRWNSARRGLRR
ncbi:RHS domain-containing protein [Streptomyces sp. NBC_00659]|uniref:RHS repeat domain-containing protein n=1 Tax=Streptomyces sp. NBC_00659 TaxID=2903669 RepID=UPI002E3031FA|nr:RHS domain-containing protein [Streptomyces sp. NBC_00659]